MSIWKNGKLVAGGSQALPLLISIWSDHILDDISWLRADTFSWQRGSAYQAVYQHLVNDYEDTKLYAWHTRNSGGYNLYTKVRNPEDGTQLYNSDGSASPYTIKSVRTQGGNVEYIYVDVSEYETDVEFYRQNVYDTHLAETETIAGTTITYYPGDDGHKIVLSDQESNVAAIYTATGVAWYYIIDTTNQRFKLPRELPITDKIKGNGLALGIGSSTTGYTEMGLRSSASSSNNYLQVSVAASATSVGSVTTDTAYYGDARRSLGIVSNPDKSGIISHRANENGKQYLYFYVGNFTQTALENTAGITAETLNDKVDKGHQVIEFQAPTAANNYTWYRKYADGWVEQGGIASVGSDSWTSVSLPVEMANTNYGIQATCGGAGGGTYVQINESGLSTTQISIGSSQNNTTARWEVKGMAA